MNEYYDVVIIGTGAAGLYCALNLPSRKKVLMLTKQSADLSDSFLAQGGICMLRDEGDYDNYFEDTMRAGHYENNKKAVDLMIRSSNDIIRDLVNRKVNFVCTEDGELAFTRDNIEICEYMTMVEQMAKDGTDYVLEDMRPLGEKMIMKHFPNIYQHCLEEGYDPRKEPIPVVPAQHYFMGGIQADLGSRTSMAGLYACGETSCNGAHGKNRAS